jgi:dTMP kinase
MYQGDGRGLGGEAVLSVNEWASMGTFPDIVVYLKVQRIGDGPRRDRIESSGESFYAAVEDGFNRWANKMGWIVIENEGSIEEIAAKIETEVRKRLD